MDRCEVDHQERASAALDRDPSSKWVSYPDGDGNHELQYKYYPQNGGVAVTDYCIITGDEPDRRPKSWTLEGSNDGGVTWTTLDAQSGISFAGSSEQLIKWFAVAAPAAFVTTRLMVTEARGETPAPPPTPHAHPSHAANRRRPSRNVTPLLSFNFRSGTPLRKSRNKASRCSRSPSFSCTTTKGAAPARSLTGRGPRRAPARWSRSPSSWSDPEPSPRAART